MRHGCSNKTPEKKSEINLQNESSPTHESEMKHNSSDDKNVDVVVTKYKRAAAFLWTVIHAQGCQLPVPECHVQGCSDTKRLLVHIQSCTASAGHACPISYGGCQQARKLIGHYKDCRKTQLAQRKRVKKSQCLLCTLLGRHKPIKTRRDGIYQTSSEHTEPNPKDREGLNAVVKARGSTVVPVSPMALTRGPSTRSTVVPVSPMVLTRSPSAQFMPPPPPRPRTASLGSIPLSHSSPMSMCSLTLSDNGEEKFGENINSAICRARSGSLDNKKVEATSSNFDNDPTVEAHLTHPTGRNENIMSCDSPKSYLPAQHRFRQRSFSCSNMSSSGCCDTVLEES